MPSGKRGPKAYRDVVHYTEEESAYLKGIEEYIESLKRIGRRFPTNTELTQVILRVAHELGYRKLEGFELAQFDAQEAQKELDEDIETKRDEIRAIRQNEKARQQEGATTRWKAGSKKKRRNRND